MKEIFLAVPIFLALLSGSAWGASQTYYVRPDSTSGGTCLGTGATGADRACATVMDAVAKGDAVAPTGTGAGQGHTYKIAPGNYTEYIAITNANQAGSTFMGCTDTTFAACTKDARDLVVNQGTGAQHGFYAGVNNLSIKYMTLWSAPGADKQALFLAGSGNVVQGTREVSKGASSSGLVYLNGTDNIDFTGNLVEGGNSNIAVRLAGDAGGTLAYNIIRGNRALASWKLNTCITNTGTGTALLYNNLCSDSVAADAISVTAASTNTFKNNIVFGPVSNTSSYGINCAAAATCTEDNNLILGNIWQSGRQSTGIDTSGGHSILDKSPGFARWGKTGFIIVRVDDAMDAVGTKYAYLSALANLMKPYGFRGTWYSSSGQNDAGEYANMRSLLTDATIGGVWEIGSHGATHQPGDATSVGTLSCTGCGANPQYKVDLTNHQVSVRTDAGGSENCTYNLTGTNSDSWTSIIAAIRANTGNKWNITYTTVGSNQMTGLVKASSCSEVDWTAIATAVALNRTDATCDGGNCAGFFKDEVYNTIGELNAIVNGAGNITDPQMGATYTARSYATPYGVRDASYNLAIKSSGFAANTTGTATLQDLTSFDVQEIRYLFLPSLIGETAADTANNIRWLCAQAAEHGLAFGLLAHTEAEASTSSGNGWPVVLRTLAEFGPAIRVVSAQEFRDTIAASPWTWTPDATYATSGVATRTYGAAAVDDNRLRGSSPARDTGSNTAWSGTANVVDYSGRVKITDGSGTIIAPGGVVDIGAYEYRPQRGSAGLLGAGF